jgi:hypothetical protein
MDLETSVKKPMPEKLSSIPTILKTHSLVSPLSDTIWREE